MTIIKSIMYANFKEPRSRDRDLDSLNLRKNCHFCLENLLIRLYRIYSFCSPGPYFFNLTHCRAAIQTGVYLSTGACYFQSKITTKIIVEDKYFTTFNLSPYDLIIT